MIELMVYLLKRQLYIPISYCTFYDKFGEVDIFIEGDSMNSKPINGLYRKGEWEFRYKTKSIKSYVKSQKELFKTQQPNEETIYYYDIQRDIE